MYVRLFEVYTGLFLSVYRALLIRAPLFEEQFGEKIDQFRQGMGWRKEPYKRDNILQKRPTILSILLIVFGEKIDQFRQGMGWRWLVGSIKL